MSELINSVLPYITTGGLVRVPDVICHEHAMQAVIATPQPSSLNHPPGSVCNDFSNMNTIVPKGRRKLVVIWVRGNEYRGHGGLLGCATALARAPAR